MNKLKRPSADFTAIPNELLRDKDLSMKAKGLYCIMFSKPDGWVFYNDCLVRESNDGKDAVRSAMGELTKYGWVVRSGGGQGPGGIFKPYEYELMLNRGGFSAADEPPRSNRSGEPACSSKPEKIKTEKRERAQSLEAFLKDNSTDAWFTWSMCTLHWTPQRCQTVFDTFRDYWRAKAGKDALKADWEATWRNWCRREGSFEKPKPLQKGEIRVCETTADEIEHNRFNQEIMRLRKLPENLRKSDDEIAKLASAALYGDA